LPQYYRSQTGDGEGSASGAFVIDIARGGKLPNEKRRRE